MKLVITALRAAMMNTVNEGLKNHNTLGAARM